jgi:MinD superfamily P-loop ATPase
MKVAIASGKGGTGKTTVATCLAHLLPAHGQPTTYVDCDVEEPNGHIFLGPRIERSENVSIPIPVIDRELCTNCGNCCEICRFNALACLPKKVMVFPSLCHGCGGCALVCPEGAITEMPRAVGVVERGSAGDLGFLQGRLAVGEALATPVIRAVKRAVPERGIVILDAPPGTSCPVVETIRGVDWVVMVTEPTPFGLNDLKLAVGAVRKLGLTTSIVINRSDVGDSGVEDYCEEEGLDVILKIPHSRTVAEAYARGEMPVLAVPGYADMLEKLADAVLTRVREAEKR